MESEEESSSEPSGILNASSLNSSISLAESTRDDDTDAQESDAEHTTIPIQKSPPSTGSSKKMRGRPRKSQPSSTDKWLDNSPAHLTLNSSASASVDSPPASSPFYTGRLSEIPPMTADTGHKLSPSSRSAKKTTSYVDDDDWDNDAGDVFESPQASSPAAASPAIVSPMRTPKSALKSNNKKSKKKRVSMDYKDFTLKTPGIGFRCMVAVT